MLKAWNFGGSRSSPKFEGFIVAFGGGWEGAEDYSKNYFLKKSPLYPNKFQLAHRENVFHCQKVPRKNKKTPSIFQDTRCLSLLKSVRKLHPG